MARCRNFVREKAHVFPLVFQCGNVMRMLRMEDRMKRLVSTPVGIISCFPRCHMSVICHLGKDDGISGCVFEVSFGWSSLLYPWVGKPEMVCKGTKQVAT